MGKAKFIWYILAIAPIALLIAGYAYPHTFLSSQEQVRGIVRSWGVYAPIAFILLQIFQVVITPINHYVISIAGGYIFGTWQGFAYNWIGRVIGTIAAFYIAKRLGKPVLNKIVSEKTREKYNWVFEKGKFLLFLMIFLPLFPDDELAYLAGLSSMRPRTFIIIAALGHVGGSLSLAYAGSGVSYTDPFFLTVVAISLILAIITFALFSKKLKGRSESP